MCWRSASDLTVTKASRSSGTSWYLRTISPSVRAVTFFIKSEKVMSRGTAMTRVSPPTYFSTPSPGLGRILPPWLHKNLILFFGDDVPESSPEPTPPLSPAILPEYDFKNPEHDSQTPGLQWEKASDFHRARQTPKFLSEDNHLRKGFLINSNSEIDKQKLPEIEIRSSMSSFHSDYPTLYKCYHNPKMNIQNWK